MKKAPIRMNPLLFLLDEGAPALAASFSDRVTAQTLEDAKTHGLDVAELRIDHFASREPSEVVARLGAFADFATLATIRLAAEGGRWVESETARLELFRAVLPHVDGVDIELRAGELLPALVREAHAPGKAVIASFHDFQATPTLPELQARVDEAVAQGADVVKLALHASHPDDVRTLAALTLANRDRRLITISMGADGLVSRVFFPALGSRLTFGYLENQTAPGQLHLAELYALLCRFYPRFQARKDAARTPLFQ